MDKKSLLDEAASKSIKMKNTMADEPYSNISHSVIFIYRSTSFLQTSAFSRYVAIAPYPSAALHA